MTLKPESSLPNIGNGSFSDFPLQSIYYQGLVRSRDGTNLSPSGQPYVSLPSPNIQSVKPPPSQSNHSQMMEDYNGRELPGPDTSQLARRGALVPPKMDGEEDYDEEVEEDLDDCVVLISNTEERLSESNICQKSNKLSEDDASPNNRLSVSGDTQSANIQDNNTTSSVQRGNRLSVNTTGKPVQLR